MAVGSWEGGGGREGGREGGRREREEGREEESNEGRKERGVREGRRRERRKADEMEGSRSLFIATLMIHGNTASSSAAETLSACLGLL